MGAVSWAITKGIAQKALICWLEMGINEKEIMETRKIRLETQDKARDKEELMQFFLAIHERNQ